MGLLALLPLSSCELYEEGPPQPKPLKTPVLGLELDLMPALCGGL